jgi:hypothetical protein
MFGLFGKRLSDADFEHIISKARISPHVKDGELVAFMIFADEDPDILAKYLRREGEGRLLQLVETRIREDGDFERSHFLFNRPGWEPNLLAKRLLVGNQQMPPICSWDVSISPIDEDQIELTTYPR